MNSHTYFLDELSILLRNDGIQKGKFGEAGIKIPGYRPLISCRLFEKVNAIRREIKGKEEGGIRCSVEMIAIG